MLLGTVRTTNRAATIINAFVKRIEVEENFVSTFLPQGAFSDDRSDQRENCAIEFIAILRSA